MGQIVFGTKKEYKEFAWMYPNLCCILLDGIKPLKRKLIEVFKDKKLNVRQLTYASDIFRKFDLSMNDTKYLMTCAMMFTLPVI